MVWKLFFHLLINGIYWGYNPPTNHLLTSWDIQVTDVTGNLRRIFKIVGGDIGYGVQGRLVEFQDESDSDGWSTYQKLRVFIAGLLKGNQWSGQIIVTRPISPKCVF